jgi:hypothetical protein
VAVRFDASGEHYTRATALGSVTQFSFSCWLKLDFDRGDYSTIWCLDSGATSDFSMLQTDAADSNQLAFYQNGISAIGVRTLTVGVWYWWGVSVNGSTVTVTSRSVGDSSFIFTSTATGDASGTNMANLRLGESIYGSEWWNGSLAAVKLWTGAALAQAELEAEAWTYTPTRTAGLAAWYPLLVPETTDYSGGGQTLSGGSGAVATSGPPIRWSAAGRRRILHTSDAAAPVQGDIGATLPALTATASGTAVVAGQQSATLPALTATATGVLTVAGQAAATLPALTADIAGEAGAPGLLDAHLPALVGAFDGLLTGGFLTATLPALTGSVLGELAVHGAASAVLPPLAASLAGEVEIPHNNLDVAVGPPYRGWSFRPLASAWTAGAPTRGWQVRQPTT